MAAPQRKNVIQNVIKSITLDDREEEEQDFHLTTGKAQNIPASMGVTKVLIYFKSHSATPGPNGILLHHRHAKCHILYTSIFSDKIFSGEKYVKLLVSTNFM